MPNTSLVVSLIIIPIASFFLYLPWQQHLKLFHPHLSDSSAHNNLNLDSCSRLAPADLAWCAQPVVLRETATAYFVCDDSRPWWDPLRGRWEEKQDKKRGSAWAWKMDDPSAQPRQLKIETTHGEDSLHPLSISAVHDGDHTTLLISNHPHARAQGVIDVYQHHPTSSDVITHSERISGAALEHQSPFQVIAVPEQWSDSTPTNRTPSFLFNALPQPNQTTFSSSLFPTLRNRYSQSGPPSIHQYLLDLFFPNSPSPPHSIFLHLASAYTTRPVFNTGSTHPTFPPALSSWDGHGSQGGSNTTLHAVFTASTSAKQSLVEQWDQHWVRGIAYGLENVVNRRTWQQVRVRWPDFVTFWNSPFKAPLRALDVDSLGRVWSVAAGDEGLSELWIDALREAKATSPGPAPGAQIYQSTFLYRLGSAIAHPWELDRIGSAKKRGIWLPKEYYSTLIYRSAFGGSADSLVKQTASAHFLPQSPTGIAVDEDRQRVIVTSSWDDGVAVCQWKQGWVEMRGE